MKQSGSGFLYGSDLSISPLGDHGRPFWAGKEKSPQYAAEINTGRLRSNLHPSVFAEIVFEVSLHSAFLVKLIQLPYFDIGGHLIQNYYITSNDRSFGCPIIYRGIIHNAILYLLIDT